MQHSSLCALSRSIINKPLHQWAKLLQACSLAGDAAANGTPYSNSSSQLLAHGLLQPMLTLAVELMAIHRLKVSSTLQPCVPGPLRPWTHYDIPLQQDQAPAASWPHRTAEKVWGNAKLTLDLCRVPPQPSQQPAERASTTIPSTSPPLLPCPNPSKASITRLYSSTLCAARSSHKHNYGINFIPPWTKACVCLSRLLPEPEITLQYSLRLHILNPSGALWHLG